MQQKTLKDIAEVITGYTFRGALQEVPNGNTQVVLAKHIDENGSLEIEHLPSIDMNTSKTNARLKKGDILLSARGIFRAAVFVGEQEDCIAASSTYIIRITDKNITPAYLSIYLNSKAGQNQIRQHLTGGTVQTLLRRDLETFQIPIPSLEQQENIISIHNNWKKREELMQQKIFLSKNIADGAINHLITV